MICNLYTLVGDFLIGSKQGHVKHELLIADHRQFGSVAVVGHRTKTMKSMATLASSLEEFDTAGQSAVNRPPKHLEVSTEQTTNTQVPNYCNSTG